MRPALVMSVTLLALAAACSSVQTSNTSEAARPETTLQVRNHKPIDFNIYVLSGTHRIRLGMITGMSTRVYTIPSHLVINKGALRFQADPIGSENVIGTAEDLYVREGEQVSITIQ